MHDSISHQDTICTLRHSLEGVLATHLRTACVGYKHQSGMLDGIDQGRYHVEDLRATDETHEVVGFGNTNGFFDGHGGFAVAIDAVVVWIGVVRGRRGAEIVAQEDWDYEGGGLVLVPYNESLSRV